MGGGQWRKPLPEIIALLPPRIHEVIEAAPPAGVRVLARAPALTRDDDAAAENRKTLTLADDQPWPHFQYWQGEFYEKVQFRMTAAAANFDRVRSGNSPLLHHHSSRELLGRLSTVWINKGQLQVEADWSRRPDAQLVKLDVDDGIERGTSIGARILEARPIRVPSMEDPDGLLEVTKWELLEGTVTPMGENPRAFIHAETMAAIQAALPTDEWDRFEHGVAGDDGEFYTVDPEAFTEIRAAIRAARSANVPDPAGHEPQNPSEETVEAEQYQAEIDRLKAELEKNKADAEKSAEIQAELDRLKSENITAAAEVERREEIRDVALRFGVGP